MAEITADAMEATSNPEASAAPAKEEEEEKQSVETTEPTANIADVVPTETETDQPVETPVVVDSDKPETNEQPTDNQLTEHPESGIESNPSDVPNPESQDTVNPDDATTKIAVEEPTENVDVVQSQNDNDVPEIKEEDGNRAQSNEQLPTDGDDIDKEEVTNAPDSEVDNTEKEEEEEMEKPVLPLTTEEIKQDAREHLEALSARSRSKEETEEEETPEVVLDPEELARIERRNQLSMLMTQVKEEAADLRSYNFHLLTQIVSIIQRNNGSLGLDVEVPSTMNPLTSASNMESKQNELYESVLKEVEYLHSEYSSKQNQFNDKIMTLNDRVIDQDEQAISLKNTYKNFKRKICKNLNKKCGTSTKIETKWILQKEEEEEEIDNQIEQERLKNIHYNINLKKLTLRIKEKDKLSDGLHLIDFEQLKIENQTLNEKIEERNDELYKLKKKITNTVQILTHIKEKLQFINKINQSLNQKQSFLDDVVNEKRDSLNELKKKRDLLRYKNAKLKQKQGFIANDVLVIDFQETKNSLKANKLKLKQCKQRYETLQKTIKLGESLKKNKMQHTI